MDRFEIVATSVTLEQEDLISPIKWSFKTIRTVPVRKGVSLSNSFSCSPMILWRDYLIGSYFGATGGLFLWSMTGNSIFYFEVCHLSFVSGRLESQFATDGVRPMLYQSR